jgi:pimeloyl-ACP methyl ester carboxylesterase
VREDVADLAALIERLDLAPAYVAGNSFGAAIALRLAAERPDLLRGLVAHEPPLFSLLAGDAGAAGMLGEVRSRIGSVLGRIAAGDPAGAAEAFFEMALGPGEWAQLPPEVRRTFGENAATFLDEARDPEQLAFDLGSIRSCLRPALLTTGEQSPLMYSAVLARLAEALPRAETLAFPAAGHLPHVTHPDAYVEAITGFIRRDL